jgi:hypothetical protein
MGFHLLIFRWVALTALSVWLGGFTFYSAIVIPILHDVLGSLETGSVTRKVTVALNIAGVVALAAWWGLVWAERAVGSASARAWRVGLLAVDTLILLGLFALHGVMSGRLDAGSLRGFYPLHRVYLIASTAQWAVNLALPAVSLHLWSAVHSSIPQDSLGQTP